MDVELDEPLPLAEDAEDEDGPSPLLAVLVLLSALLLVPSPPEVDSSLMSLALLLIMLVSSMGRFLLARDDGLASWSAVASEIVLGLPFRSFFAFLPLLAFDCSFFLRFLLLDLSLVDDVLGAPFVPTCDTGTELVLDEPRLCCWRDITSCCSI